MLAPMEPCLELGKGLGVQPPPLRTQPVSKRHFPRVSSQFGSVTPTKLDKIENLRASLSARTVSPFASLGALHRQWADLSLPMAELSAAAAHACIPTGGMGSNTGVSGIHNLCWKLAYVLGGQAPAALLERYERRRPEGLLGRYLPVA